MIYTVTFNPAIDYVVHMEQLNMGETNRTTSEKIYFGGKGINVSFVLKELGIDSKALGFVAGFIGEAIEKELSEKGIDADFVHLNSGFSRINIKMKSTEEIQETEINGQGPKINHDEINQLYDKLNQLENGDTLILAGSIPNTLPTDIYEKIIARLENKDIRIVVDATKELLLNVLKYSPFLIKPNIDELGELFGISLATQAETIQYAKKLKDMGARNVLVSMAGDGAILVDENDKIYQCNACIGEVKNSVGAGDSMIAGFLVGLTSDKTDYEYALRLATAAGGATAFSDGLAKKEDIVQLLRQIQCCDNMN